ncbi:expressed unknown protein [Seminavis robusta]|uniref:Uncharacterized protein n=1 Tax=Seminavis robusta TaxID=568900 RepID=A0A9N8DVF4_9STRA|nr:expressed unknown protein [Seminavis robusta]|eukprot:Sro275_g105610.1 n/a (403) ;mRNA; r:7535-8743
MASIQRHRLQWLTGLVFAVLLGCASAFLSSPSSPLLTRPLVPTTSSSSCLNLAKRRGNLGSIVDVAGDSSSSSKRRTQPKKRSKRLANNSSSNKKKNSSKKDDATAASAISPLLQEWASGQQQEQDNDIQEDSTAVSTASATTFTSFQEDEEEDTPTSNKKGKRASPKKQKSLQNEQDEQRKELVRSLVAELNDVLDTSKQANKKTADMNDILKPIRQLIALPNANTNLRQLLAGQTRYDYRLAWVGSDNAICHMGTGLHKVPLARLQEVYLSALGKSRVEVLEVIRIIGPFPNARNTLEGSGKIGKRNVEYNGDGSTFSELSVTYDSMIDGTGNRITAGVENNVRNYNLHILFCDETAIVAVVPPTAEASWEDPLQDNGANILFFAREETLEENLDKMRVL